MEEQPSYRFQEAVPMPLWLQAVMLVGIGAIVAGLIGPALDDSGRWTWYAVYYPVLLVALATLVIVMGSFRYLRVVVTNERVEFGFGIFRRSVPLQAIQACEVKKYNWLPYGGWGLRLAIGGRRAYSMPGTPRGVEISVEQDRKARRYFVSSTQPERLAEAISR